MLLLQDEKAFVVFTVMCLGVSLLCQCVCLEQHTVDKPADLRGR